MPTPTLHARYSGSLLGLAVGDAVGGAVEFMPPGTFPPVTDMTGGGPHALEPGEWTDDTSMALCLAESLVEKGGFDPRDQMERYLRWYREGYLSSRGHCFDIGITVATALRAFERTGQPYSGPSAENTAGNGSLMRLAPVALFRARDPETAISMAAASSRTTHGASQAVDACRYFAGLVVGALRGVAKAELLGPRWSPVPGLWDREPWHPAVSAIASGTYKVRALRELPASGYVVHTLEAVLWAFHSTDTFDAGLLAAVNLGNDADTTGAVYGQLAGAYYGVDAIPARWREKIVMRERIGELALALAKGAAS